MNELDILKNKMLDVLTTIIVLADTKGVDSENARGIISMLALSIKCEINNGTNKSNNEIKD